MTDRCASCPSRSMDYPDRCVLVPSTGPAPCRVLFLGTAGIGRVEERTWEPYTGQGGEEFTHTYLSLARLRREDVHIATTVRCWDGTDRPPHESRVSECAAHHLPSLLDSVRPEVVVLMGGVTQRIADKHIRLDMHHGIPQRNSLLGGVWEGWVWPSFEPALGMRETGMMVHLLEDFRRLGKWLEGEWAPPTPLNVTKDYRLVPDTDAGVWELESYIQKAMNNRLEEDWRRCPAIDTETHGGRTWSLQFSVAPHSGRLIQAGSKRVLEAFQAYVDKWSVEATLHNAGQDLDTLERMGVRVGKWRDTMQEAYHQGNLPQGLKSLAYRLLGVTMRSWEDVVWPASVEAWVDWAEDAIGYASTNLYVEEVTQLKRGKCVECGHLHSTGPCKRDGCGCGCREMTFEKRERKLGAVEAILKHILTYTVRTEEQDEPYNPWKKLPEMLEGGLRGKRASQGEWDGVQEAVGEMPILGIGNCDMEDAITYACSDSDHTGQVAVELKKLRESGKWAVDREDWDDLTVSTIPVTEYLITR